MGGGEHMLEYSHRTWEGITQQFTRYDSGHGHPMVVKEYEQGYDWMHQGEGYLFFYLLCLADPTENNVERAKRYAGFYLNEDPEAPNYDAEKKLIRCAHNGSMGPAHRNFDKHYTVYRYAQWKPWPLPFHDIPGIETVEDLQKPGMEEKMGQIAHRAHESWRCGLQSRRYQHGDQRLSVQRRRQVSSLGRGIHQRVD